MNANPKLFLAVAVALAMSCEARDICCQGTYGGHLQGVATDGRSVFWSFTDEVVRTDTNGVVLASSGSVPRHHGDLCVRDGVVYVAVNLGRFNQPDEGVSEVRAYEAATLKPLKAWPLPDMRYGAGGMTVAGDRFFVVGGLPATVEENPVFEYDTDFRLVRRHALATGFTLMGIQTAAFEEGRFLFGIYGDVGNPPGVLVVPRDLSSFVRKLGSGNVGILRLNGGYWTGRTRRVADKRYRGWLVRMSGYPDVNAVHSPQPRGLGELRVYFEGLGTNGWADCGYRLEPDGYHPLSASQVAFPSRGEAMMTNAVPAVGIGPGRSYSTGDLVRGIRRASETDTVLSIHVPGTPDGFSRDPKLAETWRALTDECRRLGVTVSVFR